MSDSPINDKSPKSKSPKSRSPKNNVNNVKYNAAELFAYRNKLINALKNECPKYDWSNAFMRWIFNFEHTEDLFCINLDKLISASDIEYVSVHFKAKVNPNIAVKLQLSAEEKAKIKPIHVVEATMEQSKDRLLDLYQNTNTGDNFDKDMYTLLSMYWAIGLFGPSGTFSSIFLSVPPDLIEKFGLMELFGSPLNHAQSVGLGYCSPMKIDAKFGSKGNFFNYKLQAGKRYLANPPFDETLAEDMSKRLIEECKLTKIDLLMITLPVWDSKSQKALGEKDFGLRFAAIELLTAENFPGYNFTHIMLRKNEHKYYNYSSHTLVKATNSHVVIVSNPKLKGIDGIIEKYWKAL